MKFVDGHYAWPIKPIDEKGVWKGPGFYYSFTAHWTNTWDSPRSFHIADWGTSGLSCWEREKHSQTIIEWPCELNSNGEREQPFTYELIRPTHDGENGKWFDSMTAKSCTSQALVVILSMNIFRTSIVILLELSILQQESHLKKALPINLEGCPWDFIIPRFDKTIVRAKENSVSGLVSYKSYHQSASETNHWADLAGALSFPSPSVWQYLAIRLFISVSQSPIDLRELIQLQLKQSVHVRGESNAVVAVTWPTSGYPFGTHKICGPRSLLALASLLIIIYIDLMIQSLHY